MASLSATLLDSFVGKSVEQLCPLGFGKVSDDHNHCADFVGHVLKLNSSVTTGVTSRGWCTSARSTRRPAPSSG